MKVNTHTYGKAEKEYIAREYEKIAQFGWRIWLQWMDSIDLIMQSTQISLSYNW